MPDRRRQIEHLIATRFDLLWFPRGALRTQAGLAPAKRVPCPDCGHTDHPGWTIDGFKRKTPCTTCGGVPAADGHRARRGKGVIAVDPMDATRQAVGSHDTHASSRPRRTVMCDACAGDGATAKGRCERCKGTGRRDQHVFDLALDVREDGDGEVDALTSAIDYRDRAGSYHELDLALAGISKHVNKPLRFAALTLNADQARRLLDELYLTRTRDSQSLSFFEDALVELALAYVDLRMPDPIRVPAGVIANARERQQALKGSALNGLSRERRDKLIRQWDREGKPRTWIARQTGLGDRQLREIISGKSVSA